MALQRATRSADFIERQAVAAHPHYTDSAVQANAAGILAAMRHLGVDNMRTEAPNPVNQGQATLGFLADAGIEFSFITGGDPAVSLSRIKVFLRDHPGAVGMIEGVNEPNNWPIAYAGETGAEAAQAFQADLFAAVRADPALADIPVAGMASYPRLGGASDFMNLHPYPRWARQPRETLVQEIAAQQAAEDRPKGFAITEGGWHTLVNPSLPPANGEWEGVDERTQAKLLLNFMLDGIDLGASYVAPYELYDEYADPAGTDPARHWGLFRFDGSPKPAADAIHNQNAILADPGAQAGSFATGSLDYTIMAATAINDLVVQRSDGSFFVALWNEPDLWDDAADRPIDPADESVTLAFGAAYDVAVYDPLAGTAPVQNLGHASQATVALDGSPLWLRLSNPSTAEPVGQTIYGTEGMDTLVSGGGGDTIYGWGRDDTIDAGAGDDVIHPGWGHDRVTTGSGRDRVVVLTGESGETVTDFDPASDVVEIRGAPVGGTATVTDTAGGALLVWASGDTVLLSGVQAARITPAQVPGVTLSAPTRPSGTATVGEGSDVLALRVSQDAYGGENARFAVTVDGERVGGVLEARASRASGERDTVEIRGDWGPGRHVVGVAFLNDAYGGAANADRNLYVEDAAFNGQAELTRGGEELAFLRGGEQRFSFVQPTDVPTAISAGAGLDTLVLGMSQDSYLGEARYRVSVDGKQVGGTFAAVSEHIGPQTDTLTLRGDWGPGRHAVRVEFLNDAYDGTLETDRNLYLEWASYDGAALPGLGQDGFIRRAVEFGFTDTGAIT